MNGRMNRRREKGREGQKTEEEKEGGTNGNSQRGSEGGFKVFRNTFLWYDIVMLVSFPQEKLVLCVGHFF